MAAPGPDVYKRQTLDNGTITALTVDASGETAGFGQKCGAEDFKLGRAHV